MAKEDPKFFHSLVWDTEKVLGSIDFLSREERAAIMRTSPEHLVVALATGRFGSGFDANGCAGSCAQTSHCTYTCSVSSLATDPASLVSNPATVLADRIQNEIAAVRFSHFTR
jgi:hypothetical protein